MEKPAKNVSHRQAENAALTRLTSEAMLSAIAILLMMLIRIPLIPAAPYLVYDPADVPILVGTLAFGTVPGLLMTLVVSFLQSFVFSSDGSGFYGFLMHAAATGLMVIVVGIITRHHRTLKNTVIGLVLGALAMTAGMVVMNLLITPLYTGTSIDAVEALLIPAIIPFNLIKSGLNSFLAFFLYRTLRKILPKYFGDTGTNTTKSH